MKIALDITPLDPSNPHRVRGSGFYLKHLKEALEQSVNDDEITFFTRGEKIPQSTEVVHYPYFEPFFLTLPPKNSVPTVVTVHDLTPIKFKNNFPSGLRGAIKWQIQKKRLKKADIIITDSYASKDDIIKITGYNDKKVKVIPLAAGKLFKKITSEQIVSTRKKYSLPEKYILYVGDVTWNKNLPRLLNAIKRTDLPAVLVGKSIANRDFDHTNPWNSDLVKVQKIITQSSKITALGFVSDHDLVAIYNAATVFVMPSLYEGFGLPILEAMSCGAPVITAPVGSLPEVAGDAALFADPYSIEDIAEKIEQVFRNEELQKELSEKGIERSEKFSWDKTAKLTLQVYKNLST
jgi:glycosyltransferase involved in cell wall biosynthesis